MKVLQNRTDKLKQLNLHNIDILRSKIEYNVINYGKTFKVKINSVKCSLFL